MLFSWSTIRHHTIFIRSAGRLYILFHSSSKDVREEKKGRKESRSTARSKPSERFKEGSSCLVNHSFFTDCLTSFFLLIFPLLYILSFQVVVVLCRSVSERSSSSFFFSVFRFILPSYPPSASSSSSSPSSPTLSIHDTLNTDTKQGSSFTDWSLPPFCIFVPFFFSFPSLFSLRYILMMRSIDPFLRCCWVHMDFGKKKKFLCGDSQKTCSPQNEKARKVVMTRWREWLTWS